MNVIVLKYGGSSLSSPEHIKKIAQDIVQKQKSGLFPIVIVSAMGNYTNQLLDLAQMISNKPNHRELDMLMSAGERISMSLMSMALWELKAPAISFTGSQAGILTSPNHSAAHIINLKPIRLEKELKNNKIIVLAGFQGVCDESKDVTTLGRGGTDTTAVALSIYFKASACQIMKDVDGIFSADPKIVPQAKLLKQITFNSLKDMTFWGSRVLHFRSVLLAENNNVKLMVGNSFTNSIGTHIMKDLQYEQTIPLSINSHNNIKHLQVKSSDLNQGIELLHDFLGEYHINDLQILASTYDLTHSRFMLTGPTEQVEKLTPNTKDNSIINLTDQELSSVSITYSGPITTEVSHTIARLLKQHDVIICKLLVQTCSVSIFVSPDNRERAIQLLHKELIES